MHGLYGSTSGSIICALLKVKDCAASDSTSAGMGRQEEPPENKPRTERLRLGDQGERLDGLLSWLLLPNVSLAPWQTMHSVG